MFFQDINNFKTFLNIIINTIPNKHVVSTMKQRKLKKKKKKWFIEIKGLMLQALWLEEWKYMILNLFLFFFKGGNIWEVWYHGMSRFVEGNNNFRTNRAIMESEKAMS
jgi:hypothetical protein